MLSHQIKQNKRHASQGVLMCVRINGGGTAQTNSNQPGPNGSVPNKVSQPKQIAYVPISPISRQQSKDILSLDNKRTNQLLMAHRISLGSCRSLRRRTDGVSGIIQLAAPPTSRRNVAIAHPMQRFSHDMDGLADSSTCSTITCSFTRT